jgi:hypothetical protein
VGVRLSKQFPDFEYITAVQAASWLGLGEALTSGEIAEAVNKQQTVGTVRSDEIAIGWSPIPGQVRNGAQLLFRAHARGQLTLTGRLRDRIRSDILNDREDIPRKYFADSVALDQKANCIGPDPAVKSFAKFEENQGLSIWHDVMVLTAEVRALVSEDAGSVETVTTGNSDAPPERRTGRPQGAGAFSVSDNALLEEMHRIRNANPDMSVWKATEQVVPKATGGGTDESKRRRLAAKYLKKYPR